MAKDVDLTSREWSDIVFEGRNKAYGAYVLRTDSKPRHMKAFIYTVVGLIVIGIGAYSYLSVQAYIAEQAAITDQASQELVAFVDQAEEEPEEEVQEKVEMPEPEALPEEILNTVKVTELLIAKDEEVKK